MNTILGVFDDPIAARRAVDALRASPMNLDDVSIITRNTESGAPISSVDDVSAGEGAAVGAVWGGLVGLASLLIPGVGPFIAFGALGAALTGAVTGAVVGGITAALVDFGGIPEDEARNYETMIHTGKTLVAVKARDEDTQEVRRLLASAGADSIRDNQTDITGSANAPISVAMYDERGKRMDHEMAVGGPPNPVTSRPGSRPTSRGVYDYPEIDRGANMTRPVAEPGPPLSSTATPTGAELGTGRAGQVQPRESGGGVTSIENEGTTTPDNPPLPRTTGRDTNVRDPDDTSEREM
jgi:uncharacterized membrane protein